MIYPGPVCAAPLQVNFWRSLEEALHKVEGQLGTPQVRVTMKVLKQARRIIALAALENNTGLDTATKVRQPCLGFTWLVGIAGRSRGCIAGDDQL